MERIFMPSNRESFDDVKLAKALADGIVILDPTMVEGQFVTSNGTVYRITSIDICAPKENHPA